MTTNKSFKEEHDRLQQERLKSIHSAKQQQSKKSSGKPTENDSVLPLVEPSPKNRPPNTVTTTLKVAQDSREEEEEFEGDLIIDVPNGPRLGAQVKLDIGRISGQVGDSGLRSLIGGFQRTVSPNFSNDGDSHFPRTHKAHAKFRDNAAMPGFGNVLLFHIGAAILAYYNIVKEEATEKDLRAIDRLHRIAQRGATSYKVFGTDFKGYYLQPLPLDEY